MYALGDCCMTRCSEAKAIYPILVCGKSAAENLKNFAFGKQPTSKIPGIISDLFIISLGRKDAIFVMNGMVQRGKNFAEQKLGAEIGQNLLIVNNQKAMTDGKK
jgi:hypothetical protein